MEYEKLSNEIDNSNEEGSEGDDQLPRIIYRSNPWTRRAVIGFGLLILIQTITLISLISKHRVKDPSLGLWC
jgi:hypothetical protein